MEFEDILLEVGDYGKYQQHLLWIFLVPAAALLPWFTMNIFFMVSVPDHWCYVPEVVNSNLSFIQQRGLVSPPDEKCLMYNVSFADLIENGTYELPVNTSKIPCTQGWLYDDTYYDSTAATRWNMVCDDSHYNSFVLTLFSVGSIIGTPIYGALSDRIGRKITFFIVLVITAVTAIASVLMTNFTAFVVIKTINGSLMPCVFQLPFIIILELVAPEVRTRMNGVVNLAWTFGLSFLPLVAYLTRSFINLGLVTSSVALVYFLYWKFLPESPRWLVSVERYDDAVEIMYKIGQKNGKVKEKEFLLKTLQKLGEKMKKEKTEDGVKNSSADLIRYPQLRKKFLIITFCWMANIMSYYGLQLNISNLAGNEFINFFLLSLVEIPGYLTSWLVMEKIGRRWCTVITFLLTGVICLISTLQFPHGDVICSMIGKYFSAASFMATYQQSSELYPTVVRSLGMGMSSTVASIATLITPYLVYLSIYGKAIPFVIIGLCSILAGIVASFLPETLNENLPQTIFDAEEFGKDQKYFSYKRRKRSISRDRAASMIVAKPSGLDFNSTENIAKKSQIMQNVELARQSSCVSADSVKILNGGVNKTKRNSGHNVAKEIYYLSNSNGLDASATKNRSESKESEGKVNASYEGENVDGRNDMNLEDVVHGSSFDNKVFESDVKVNRI